MEDLTKLLICKSATNVMKFAKTVMGPQKLVAQNVICLTNLLKLNKNVLLKRVVRLVIMRIKIKNVSLVMSIAFLALIHHINVQNVKLNISNNIRVLVV
jgi:hypothetical protein